MDAIKVGLLGLGNVGAAVARYLLEERALVRAKLGVELALGRVAARDVTRSRGFKIPPAILTTNPYEVVEDSSVQVVVELIGGVELPRKLVLKALAAGKHVVTANKALLALHGPEIYAAAADANRDLLFEAAVAGGVPIIRSLREGLAANRIDAIFGIVNGTCNFILSEMTAKSASFEDVLAEAQKLGYAEADPTFDIEGNDAQQKLALLIALAYGAPVEVGDIYREGIGGISDIDILGAYDLGCRIKLLAIAKRQGDAVEARVHPTMIPEGHLLAQVDGPLNAVFVRGDLVGPTLFYGPGAGGNPTASAVLSDLFDAARNLLSNSPRRVTPLGAARSDAPPLRLARMDDWVGEYYLRFTVRDTPGVLAKIAEILGRYRISIKSMIQHGRDEGAEVPIILMTHDAREREIQAAIAEIDALEVVLAKTNVIRIEWDLS